MKTTTTETAKQIVSRYAHLIKKAEKAWDTEEVARLLAERNEVLEISSFWANRKAG